jgi:ABC-type Zn uptake system ZnuABC Zn-binding protein ZnuA
MAFERDFERIGAHLYYKTIERVAKDAGVKIGGELFSDATDTPAQKEKDYDLGTYEGMIKHNLNTIVEALK